MFTHAVTALAAGDHAAAAKAAPAGLAVTPAQLELLTGALAKANGTRQGRRHPVVNAVDV